jgi:hypothetical protein
LLPPVPPVPPASCLPPLPPTAAPSVQFVVHLPELLPQAGRDANNIAAPQRPTIPRTAKVIFREYAPIATSMTSADQRQNLPAISSA